MSDEGSGVSAEEKERLFSRDPQSTGSGLGLALARSLVESEGGRLQLIRSRPARFEIIFRCTSPA